MSGIDPRAKVTASVRNLPPSRSDDSAFLSGYIQDLARVLNIPTHGRYIPDILQSLKFHAHHDAALSKAITSLATAFERSGGYHNPQPVSVPRRQVGLDRRASAQARVSPSWRASAPVTTGVRGGSSLSGVARPVGRPESPEELRDRALIWFLLEGGLRLDARPFWRVTPHRLSDQARFIRLRFATPRWSASEGAFLSPPAAGIALLSPRFLQEGGRIVLGTPQPGEALLFGRDEERNAGFFARIPFDPDPLGHVEAQSEYIEQFLSTRDRKLSETSWIAALAEMMHRRTINSYSVVCAMINGVRGFMGPSSSKMQMDLVTFSGQGNRMTLGDPPAPIIPLLSAARFAGIRLRSLSMLQPRCDEDVGGSVNLEKPLAKERVLVDELIARSQALTTSMMHRFFNKKGVPVIGELFMPLLLGASGGETRRLTVYANKVIENLEAERFAHSNDTASIRREYIAWRNRLDMIPQYGNVNMPCGLTFGSVNLAGTQMLAAGSLRWL